VRYLGHGSSSGRGSRLLLDVDQLAVIARQLLDRLDDELNDMVDDYVVQQEIDRLRGK
jgi:hypothetical protein